MRKLEVHVATALWLRVTTWVLQLILYVVGLSLLGSIYCRSVQCGGYAWSKKIEVIFAELLLHVFYSSYGAEMYR